MKKYLVLIIPLFVAACMKASPPAPSLSPGSTVSPVVVPSTRVTITNTPAPAQTAARRAVLTLDGQVYSATFSPDGRTVAAAYAHGNHLALALWDTSSALRTGGKMPLHISTNYPAREARLSFNSDGSRLIVSIGKAVFLVNIAHGNILHNEENTYLDISRSAAFYPDGKSLLIDSGGASFEKIAVDDLTSLPELIFPGPYLMVNIQYIGPEWDDARKSGLDETHLLVFSPSGKQFAAGGGRFIGLWDAASGTREKFHLGFDFVQSISFSPNEKSLAFVAGNNQLYIWDLTGADPPRLGINGGVGPTAKYSPDGKLLAVGMADGEIQLRDAASLQLIHIIRAHSGLVTGVDFSSDGSLLVSSSYDGSVTLWDVKAAIVSDTSQSSPTEPPLPSLSALTLSPGEALTLTDIHMLDTDYGWSIDSSGHLLRTSDGGIGWQDVSPTRFPLSPDGFFALDNKTAWATTEIPSCYRMGCPAEGVTTGVVLHTTDGGLTWRISQPFPLEDSAVEIHTVPYYHPLAMQFIDSQTGWLLVSVDHRMQRDFYRLFRTSDGGSTWSRLIDQTNGPPLAQSFGIAFLNPRLGWLAGEGPEEEYSSDFTYITQDGGVTFQPAIIYPGIPANFPCNWHMRIRPQPPDGLYIGFENQVYQSGECGESLESEHFSGNSLTLSSQVYFERSAEWKHSGDPYFLNTKVGWTLDNPGPGQSNQLQQTLDGGAAWQVISLVAWRSALFDFVNEQIGWAIVGDGTNSAFVHTINGGKTWTLIKPVVAP